MLPSLIETMRSYIGFDISSLVFVDELYRPVDSFTGSTRRPDLHALYLSQFFTRLETNAMLSSADLLRSDQLLDNTSAYGSRYYDSDFFDVVCRPVDLVHGIRLPLRDGKMPIACLVLSRPPGSKAFAAADEARALKARDFLTHALSRTQPSDDGAMAPGETGVIIMSSDGRIQHLSATGDRLLHMALRPRMPSGAFGDIYHRYAQSALLPLVQKLNAIDRSSADAVPALYLRNHWGRFSFRCYWLNPAASGMPALISIQITRHIPLALKLLCHSQVQALPQREKEICVLLAQGHSTPAIAQQLKRSPHTVISQVRSLYNRFSVSSRNELLSLLLAPDESTGTAALLH